MHHPPAPPRIRRDPSWFTTSAGDPVGLFTLRNSRGMEVAVSEWGATLVSLRVPPEPGSRAPREVLLGWARPARWEENPTWFGSTVGRFANRVAHGRFQLDGRPVSLAVNAPPHQLHGGPGGFSHRLWRGVASKSTAAAREGPVGKGPDAVSVEFHLRSRDGDQGWPGNLDVVVRYTLDDHNRLTMTCQARTDAPTHVNLTNHAYLNLAGVTDEPLDAREGRRPSGDRTGPAPVHDHRLRLHASRFTPADEAGIPTGEIRPVEGTPLDFTEPRALGEALTSPLPLVSSRGGLDHNFVLDGGGSPADPHPCARVEHPPTGRVLEVATSCPGLQVYTANGLDETDVRGGRYRPHAALCLETQFFPDTPNRPDFPSTRLDPGQVWHHVTTWRLLPLSGPETA